MWDNLIQGGIIGVLVLIAGISNAVMDTVFQHWKTSIFYNIKKKYLRLWFKEHSILKYEHEVKEDSEGNLYAIKLSDKPAFFLSKTMLVFVTDGWHFFQFIMLSSFTIAICVALGLVFWESAVLFIVLKGVFSIWFSLFYDKILKIKK